MSRFGVVVISPAYMDKDYPQRELQALISRETQKGGYILPVLHDLEHDVVKDAYPLIADNLAISTSKGVDHVADVIFKRISIDRLGDTSPAEVRYFPNFDFPLDLLSRAIDATEILLNPATWPHLRPKRDMVDSSVWMGSDDSALVRILYDLYTPIALFRQLSYALKRSLSSYGPAERFRYLLLESAFVALTNEEELAHSGRALEYTPRVPNWRCKRAEMPRRYWWQGLSEERFDEAVRAFVSEGNKELEVSVTTFPDFRRAYISAYRGSSSSQKPVGLLANALYGFTPEERPVYFRLLLHWRLCFERILAVDEGQVPDTTTEISLDQVDFPTDGASESKPELEAALTEYWEDTLTPKFKRYIERMPTETKD